MLVSCRATCELIEAVERLGIAPSAFLDPLGLDRAQLTDPSGTMEWSTLVKVIQQISVYLGGDAGRLRAVGRSMNYVPAFAPLQSLARSIVSLEQLYRVTEQWVIPAHFPHVRLFMKLASRERLMIHMAIPEPHAPCEPFFHLATGAAAETPVLIGMVPAEILDARVTPRSLDLVLGLPQQRSLVGATVRRLRSLLSSHRTNLIILEQQRKALAEGLESVQRAGDELQTLLDRQPGMVVIHAEGEIVFVNRALVKALDWDEAAQLVGRRFVEIADPRSTNLFEPSRPTAEQHSLELRQGWLRKRDGSSLLVEATAAQEVIYRGEASRLTVATDIVERERMRQQLAAADRLSTLGLLAAGVAHEINNPLAYVLNNVEFARKHLNPRGPDEPAVGALTVALEGVDRIRTIVRELLLLARADDATIGPTEVQPVVESTLALARVEIDRTTKLVLDLSPAPQVRASAARLAQIVLNLLFNALEAMRPRDPAENELTIRIGDSMKGHAFLEVSDNGPGIAPSDAPRVFEPFFTTKPAGHGTGLGLAITQRLVIELNGEIEFTSTPGQGTTFRVLLPALE